MAEHLGETDTFRIQIANYELASGKEELLAYTGHFTSFSAIVGLGNILFGYSQYQAIWFNLAFSALLSLVLYILVFQSTNDTASAVISVAIFASSPATNVFQSAALSETYSSLIIAIYLCHFFSFWRDSYPSKIQIILLASSLFLCLLIKRENMVLLASLPIIYYRFYVLKRPFAAIVLACLLFAYFMMVKPFSTETLEAESINTSTFSLSYLLVQLPAYLKALFNLKLFGVASLFLLLTVLGLAYKKATPSFESLIACAILLGFVFIYCIHYRSRYFVISMEMSAFETFRYANNFYFLIPLLFGLNFKSLQSLLSLNRYRKQLATLLVGSYILGGIYTQNMRVGFQQEEYQKRFLPIIEASNAIDEAGGNSKSQVLVTDIPLVARVLVNKNMNLQINEFNESDLNQEYREGDDVYFLLPKDIVEINFQNLSPLIYFPLDANSEYLLFRLN